MNDPRRLFEECGALKTGHFRLSSGLHSGVYFQSALVLQSPARADAVATGLAEDGTTAESVEPPAATDAGSTDPAPTTTAAEGAAFADEVSLDEGFKRAQRRMEKELRWQAKREIGGDEQRIHEVVTRWDGLTYKHVLLPIWMLAIRHQGRPYRVIVNGATGEVQGERPWSALKITLAALAVAGVAAGIYFLR